MENSRFKPRVLHFFYVRMLLHSQSFWKFLFILLSQFDEFVNHFCGFLVNMGVFYEPSSSAV